VKEVEEVEVEVEKAKGFAQVTYKSSEFESVAFSYHLFSPKSKQKLQKQQQQKKKQNQKKSGKINNKPST